ncbi:hypothetical protein [Micromonospora robiginosa]|uniref:Phage head morphogenesis domain-containing protein n=1 Tax=Micromonospora robiginosa TaxID=2749844 RepID=A0A7L6B7Z1_9ACTN|nr:hypothetical protein [Micromonospora ferruginea]QLQ37981.1 hypothetical protein H1D33_03555 [Micromonospora ferruginea]
MGVDQVAAAHYRRQAALARRVARELARLWRRVDGQAIAGSWQASLPAAVQVLSTGQALAAAAATVYVDDALEAQGLTGATEGRLQVAAFAGVASDGRDLAGLLYQPAVTALTGIRQGATVGRALAGGQLALDAIARTQVADAGRAADQVALVTRPDCGGYVRLLVGRSCSRCVILAGRWYRWNAGFRRHPRCDCRHIPSREDRAGDLRTDPREYFASLPREEQDRAFTAAGAAAIRDGADLAKVVNARRGTQVAGGRLFTTEAAGRRPRLMPEQIYRDARDRKDAIRLLRLHGYIT